MYIHNMLYTPFLFMYCQCICSSNGKIAPLFATAAVLSVKIFSAGIKVSFY